ncbi:hypothetical protein LTR37_001608 [Vermiconidia calcicola]|uniref:Uncharacterized protein n=1 Tax=Vermiconidia calcicola TaxID=1690605 RepID=A0ACC3NV62_9PEZI|nr:hypothetical protein LTR37_001608 [Vermiconidia calcicola]
MNIEVATVADNMQQIEIVEPDENKDCPTTLPTELRNRIYDFVFPRGFVWLRDLLQRGSNNNPERRTPALCRTSRLLRKEGLAIWRSSNAFQMTSYEDDRDPTINLSCLVHAGFSRIQHIKWISALSVPTSRIVSLPIEVRCVIIELYVTHEHFKVQIETRPVMDPARHGTVLDRYGIRKAAEAKAKGMISMLECLLERELNEGDQQWQEDDEPDWGLTTYLQCPRAGCLSNSRAAGLDNDSFPIERLE